MEKNRGGVPLRSELSLTSSLNDKFKVSESRSVMKLSNKKCADHGRYLC